jgi:hypothetical protein
MAKPQKSADPHTLAAANYLRQDSIVSETETRLAADPDVQAWLRQFADDGRGLLAHYAESKARYLVHGPRWLKSEKFLAAWPRHQAYRRLWEIQQKKLFNLQCRWRAGQLELPGLTDGHEFEVWAQHIHRCPLLDPIAAEDLNLYLDYLRSETCQDLVAGVLPPSNWQDYDNFRHWRRLTDAGAAWPELDRLRPTLPSRLVTVLGGLFNYFYHYPAWYAYYDQARGTGPLLTLPDQRPAPVSPAPPAPPYDPEPGLKHLSPHDQELTETLFRHFENPALLRYRRVMEHQTATDHLSQTARDTFAYLCDIPEAVPIPAGADWRDCLSQAYVAHQRQLVSDALRRVYDDYSLRQHAGIAHPAPK